MPIPNLIHSVFCVIARRSSGTTAGVIDPRAKEPVGGTVRDETFTLTAQPHWTKTFNEEPVPGGSTDKAKGYLLFRYYDLWSQSLVSEDAPDPEVLMGMRVIALGRRTGLNYFITRVEDKAHYDEASLVKAWVEDRAPGNPPRRF